MPTACCGKRNPPLRFAFRGGHSSEVIKDISIDEYKKEKKMSKQSKTHFQKLHFLTLAPIAALIGTPLFPFVNNGGFTFGLPNVCVWVMSWSVVTTLILALLFQREPELDEEVMEILGERADASSSKAEVK
jgi:hypothetical protein